MIRGYKKGFTLIELMLAMSFISVLLLSIAMVGIQAGKMYSRGIVLRDVNQAGRDISDTIRRIFFKRMPKRLTLLA
jgi:prepilin-type N-terminal cleavage/methylation domain-containing protein